MSPSEAFSIPSPFGPLAAVVHLPSRSPAPVVVCCHGLLSSKNSLKYVALGEEFAQAGFAVVRFDFSGCGESGAVPAGNLLASRTQDLDAVLRYVRQASWAGSPVGLLGSSMGGYLALLVAASGKHDIRAVVCWATPFDLNEVSTGEEVKKDLTSVLPPGFGIGDPMDLKALVPVPGVLIIHGQQDDIVSWKDALRIYRQVGEPKRLLLMKTAEHRFLDPSCRRLAMRMSLDWFVEHHFLDGDARTAAAGSSRKNFCNRLTD